MNHRTRVVLRRLMASWPDSRVEQYGIDKKTEGMDDAADMAAEVLVERRAREQAPA